MDPIRVYPLRLNKRKWSIPLHSTHECTSSCSKTFTQDTEDPCRFILVDNPDYNDGKCAKHHKLTNSNVSLADFNIDDPRSVSGPLLNPDEVVIPDNKISIDITYPILNPVSAMIDFGHSNVTRKELIEVIHKLYSHIYEEEERTSPPVIYNVLEKCDECFDTVEEYIENTDPPDEDCSICYECYDDKEPGKLPCGHIFHKQCILTWMENKQTCPYCRGIVVSCENCEGHEWVVNQHISVVIPPEHRGMILNRNTTHGIFGIYGYDLEDLVINSMKYDRVKKLLSIRVLV